MSELISGSLVPTRDVFAARSMSPFPWQHSSPGFSAYCSPGPHRWCCDAAQYTMMSRSDVRGFVSRVHVSKLSGKLEVLDPEADSLKWAETRKACMCDSQKFADKQQPINLQDGKLQVLGPTENVFIHSAESASWPGSSTGRQGSVGRRNCAPIKQIPLCTVKPITPSSNIPDYNVDGLKDSKKIDADPIQKEPEPPNIESTELHSASLQNPNGTEQPQESSSDEDEIDSEKPAAPIELLAEFIKAVMDEDYKLALKLCQMILLYEPENPEAKEFSQLIQKMLQNEEDLVGDEDDSEDTDEDDSSDSSDSDDSDSSSTETSEESSEDEADD